MIFLILGFASVSASGVIAGIMLSATLSMLMNKL
jgi:hypothetical protein